jgi:hypothetical protein
MWQSKILTQRFWLKRKNYSDGIQKPFAPHWLTQFTWLLLQDVHCVYTGIVGRVDVSGCMAG